MTSHILFLTIVALVSFASTASALLIETKQCVDFNNYNVQVSKNKTATLAACKTNSCNGGCCRYHTSQLICDPGGVYPQQPCVCNSLTKFIATPNPAVTITVTKAPTTTCPTTAPNTPAPTPAAQAPASSSIDRNTPAGQCIGDLADGSVWHTLSAKNNLGFKLCGVASDCEGVIVGTGVYEKTTCCKKSFCWCDKYKPENAADCVPSP
jgi:hypothetical protein